MKHCISQVQPFFLLRQCLFSFLWEPGKRILLKVYSLTWMDATLAVVWKKEAPLMKTRKVFCSGNPQRTNSNNFQSMHKSHKCCRRRAKTGCRSQKSKGIWKPFFICLLFTFVGLKWYNQSPFNKWVILEGGNEVKYLCSYHTWYTSTSEFILTC